MAEEYELSTIAAAALRLYAEETGRGQIEETGGRCRRHRHPERRRRVTEATASTAAQIAAVTAVARARFEAVGRQGSRLFMNVGHNLGIRPQDIVGAIANEANIPGRSIGSIDIFDGYSFVEVPAEDAQRIIDALSPERHQGQVRQRRGRPAGRWSWRSRAGIASIAAVIGARSRRLPG